MPPRLRPVIVLPIVALIACSAQPTHDDAPLPTPSQTSAAADGPASDCDGADGVRKLVCDDPQLADLDRRLAQQEPVPDAAFTTTRDDCWQNADVKRCLVEAYQTRLVELHVDDPNTAVPDVVTYVCPTLGTTAFTAQFYNDFDPNAAVLSLGEDTAITFIEPSGSGTRYGRDGVEFAEHQGEVTVNFRGSEFVCSTP